MDRICPNCGKELPEEASFCLFCFTDITKSTPAADVNKCDTPAETQHAKKVKISKKTASRVGFAAAFFFIALISVFAMKNAIADNSLKQQSDGTTVITETSAVAVTDEAGSAVTDEAGEQVFDIVTVTKVQPVETTQKRSVFDKIFKTSDNSATTDKPSQTQKEESFFEKLFGNDDKVSTTSATAEAQSKPSPSTTAKSEPTLGTIENDTSVPSATTTQTPETQVPVTNEAPHFTPVEDFEYSISGKYATITGYKGNDETVTIPAQINSCYVTSVNGGTFKNNSTVKTVTFQSDDGQPYLWVRSGCFTDCSALRVINFPDTDLGIVNGFASNCPSVEKLTLQNGQYRYVDGSLYYYSGKTWKLRYHCPAHPTTQIKLPSYCDGIEGASNLEEARNVKNIYINAFATDFPDQMQLPGNLENIFVDSDSDYGYDINGIAFSYDSTYGTVCAWPDKNKTKTVTLPDKTYLDTTHINNSNLETVYIPKGAVLRNISDFTSKRCFPSLKTLCIQDSHANFDYIVRNTDIETIKKY